MKAKKFEELLDELQVIVKKLENDDVDLEEAIKTYEQGMLISKECHKRLDAAERKVKLVMKNNEGALEEEDFEDVE